VIEIVCFQRNEKGSEEKDNGPKFEDISIEIIL
jgi:hypothetical protein